MAMRKRPSFSALYYPALRTTPSFDRSRKRVPFDQRRVVDSRQEQPATARPIRQTEVRAAVPRG